MRVSRRANRYDVEKEKRKRALVESSRRSSVRRVDESRVARNASYVSLALSAIEPVITPAQISPLATTASAKFRHTRSFFRLAQSALLLITTRRSSMENRCSSSWRTGCQTHHRRSWLSLFSRPTARRSIRKVEQLLQSPAPVPGRAS